MKKTDLFILKAFIGPFVAILLVVVFVLMMQFLWLYIDELVGKGLSMSIILEFMMWGGCTILPLALPLATLLSSMMTLGQMGENYELMALKSAGVSVVRVMLPIFVSCFVISIGAFFAGNNLVPKAFNEIYTLRDDISKTKDEIKIPDGTFYNGIDGYILRVQEQKKKGGMMYGVMVYDHTSGKGNVSVTTADSARMKMSGGKDYLVFTMYNGSNYQEDNVKRYRDTTLQLQRIDFQEQDLVIPLKNYAFQKSDSSRFGDQVKCLRLTQLIHSQDSLSRQVDSVHQRSFKSTMYSTSFFMREQLDTANFDPGAEFFYSDRYMKWSSLNEKIEALSRAGNVAEEFVTEASRYEMSYYEPLFYLRRTNIEMLKKFAQALACLILFFVGAPLGALIKKGGLGTSAIVSVLFFVLYWVVDISGTKLARDGAISASIGVFISSVVMLGIGVFLMVKASHDSDLFNMDSLKNAWRKLTRGIRSLFHRTRIVYMGTPDFAVAALDKLVQQRSCKVVSVVTVADKPSGRGLRMNESAVKQYAVAHGIPVLQPVSLKDPVFIAQLKDLKADLFVVVAFRMLPEVVWSMPRLGTFNLHAALLPQYRGAAPINWAVINGERITGVTTFMLDKDIDTGGILLRQEHRIGPEDTAGDVHDALMEIGSDLVLQTIEGIEENAIEQRVQRSFIQGSEVLKPAPKLSKELCHIDWNDTTESIHNLIRGLSPYPTAYTEIVRDGAEGVQLKIFKAHRSAYCGIPGQVLSDGKTYLGVATADGAIMFDDIQLAGKKRMSVEDFLKGSRDPESWSTTFGTSKAEILKTRS